jgi:hypothetical protein
MRRATSTASSCVYAVPAAGYAIPSRSRTSENRCGPRPGRSPRGRAHDRDAGVLERVRELERGLTAEGHDDTLRPLGLDDVHHVFEGQRLEVEAVGGVVVGRDRLGVAVHHDRLVTEFRNA